MALQQRQKAWVTTTRACAQRIHHTNKQLMGCEGVHIGHVYEKKKRGKHPASLTYCCATLRTHEMRTRASQQPQSGGDTSKQARRRAADLTMGPSCRMCSSSTSGRSWLSSRWMKVSVSCTSTDGTSVKSSVRPCQKWSER